MIPDMDGKCDRELLEKIQISSFCVRLEVEERGQKGGRKGEEDRIGERLVEWMVETQGRNNGTQR